MQACVAQWLSFELKNLALVNGNLEYKHVVTSFLQSDRKILLLLRSSKVGTYKGRWAAVSGYVEADEDPLKRARTEIQEEVGLKSDQIGLLRSGDVLRAFDDATDTVWIVHPFLFEVQPQTVRLDWEHSEFRWVDPEELASYETVPKLKETFDRVRWDYAAVPVALSNVLGRVEDLAHDKVHGASYLGRRAIDLVAEATRVSNAMTLDELFRDILSVASRLRSAQPSMANMRNLIGKLLYDIDLKRQNSGSVIEFRQLAISLAEEAVVEAKQTSEDASRNAVAILPSAGQVLTHSYSSTVKRALELGMKGRRRLLVYATESHPGLEGKQFAKDLIDIGVPVKLIADSAAASVISDVDLVLVGADSVLADGSLVHKVGTKNIAETASSKGVPFYVASETMKFSAADFLGEPVEVSESYFDVTLGKYISKFITEAGAIEPEEVKQQIRRMLRELYP